MINRKLKVIPVTVALTLVTMNLAPKLQSLFKSLTAEAKGPPPITLQHFEIPQFSRREAPGAAAEIRVGAYDIKPFQDRLRFFQEISFSNTALVNKTEKWGSRLGALDCNSIYQFTREKAKANLVTIVEELLALPKDGKRSVTRAPSKIVLTGSESDHRRCKQFLEALSRNAATGKTVQIDGFQFRKRPAPLGQEELSLKIINVEDLLYGDDGEDSDFGCSDYLLQFISLVSGEEFWQPGHVMAIYGGQLIICQSKAVIHDIDTALHNRQRAIKRHGRKKP